jgi:predicted transposase YbfD/YdcC
MTRSTTLKNGVQTTEHRYFISSLKLGVKEAARAIRGHWMVESYHWHLDVTFREDENHTIEKQAVFNLNIMRKLALSVLRIFEVRNKRLRLKKKRFTIGANPERRLEYLLSL